MVSSASLIGLKGCASLSPHMPSLIVALLLGATLHRSSYSWPCWVCILRMRFAALRAAPEAENDNDDKDDESNDGNTDGNWRALSQLHDRYDGVGELSRGRSAVQRHNCH